MPILLRYLGTNTRMAAVAGCAVCVPAGANAQGLIGNPSPSVYLTVAIIAILAVFALLWGSILRLEYRHLKHRIHQSGESGEYREMLRVSPDAVLISHCDQLVYANPAALKLFDARDFLDLARHRPFDLVHPDFLAKAEAMRRESMQTGRGTNYAIIRHKTVKGRDVDTEVACAPVSWEGASVNMVILRDVSGRVLSERKLRESEERHRDLIESAPDGLYVQMAGKIVFMNAAAGRFSR
jgi:PAS domain S-box-containing protein